MPLVVVVMEGLPLRPQPRRKRRADAVQSLGVLFGITGREAEKYKPRCVICCCHHHRHHLVVSQPLYKTC